MNKLYAFLLEKATAGLVVFGILLSILPQPLFARVPNDPNYSDQKKMWEQINAPAAWDLGTGSRKVVVAVIDTGVDTWHDDLRGNIWTNPGEIADNGLDDDHNGYIDDVNGWNFVDNNNNVRTSVFEVKDDPEAVRHGTLIAGLIGAVGDNGHDGVGVNWQVKIMPIRAIDSSGSGLFTQVIAAVDYAVKNGADVISMSFVGEDPVGGLREALRRAYDKGVVIVAAAGNHGREISGDLDAAPLYPACFDSGDSENWLLTVAAVNGSDRLSRFSDFGRCVDIAAPGEGIYSTERYAPQFGYNYEFGGEWKGTSFAVPIVAGASALLKSLHPGWRPSAIISTLMDAADKIESVNPEYRGKIGAGRLNIGRALSAASSMEPPETTAEGELYYYDKHEVWRQEIKKSAATLVAAVTDGDIVSVSPIRDGSESKGQTVLLFKRGRVPIVRQLSKQGTIIARDFIVPLSARRQTLSVRAFATEGGVFPIVEQFDARSKKIIFTEFNGSGKKLKEITVPALVSEWQVSAENHTIIAVTVRQGAVSVSQLPLDEQSEALQVTIPGVSGVLASAVGHFWLGGGEQVALVVRDPSTVSLVVVDLPSGSYRFDEIQDIPGHTPWKIATMETAGGTRQTLLPFETEGGVFSVFAESGATAERVAVPKIGGFID